MEHCRFKGKVTCYYAVYDECKPEVLHCVFGMVEYDADDPERVKEMAACPQR